MLSRRPPPPPRWWRGRGYHPVPAPGRLGNASPGRQSGFRPPAVEHAGFSGETLAAPIARVVPHSIPIGTLLVSCRRELGRLLEPASDLRIVLLMQVGEKLAADNRRPKRVTLQPGEAVGIVERLVGEHLHDLRQAGVRLARLADDFTQQAVLVHLVNPVVDLFIADPVGRPDRVGLWSSIGGSFQPLQRARSPAGDVGGEVLECPVAHRARLQHARLTYLDQQRFPRIPLAIDRREYLAYGRHRFFTHAALLLRR